MKYDLKEIKTLKQYIEQLEIYYNEWNIDDFEDEDDTYDYEDIEKNIRHIRLYIKNIVESWDE